MVELILTSALVACAIALEIVAKRLKRDPDTVYELVVIGFCFLVLIWAPPYVRSLLVGGLTLLATFALELGLVVTVVMAGLVIAAGLWLPGGVSVMLLLILALVGFTQVRAAREHLIRLSRAAGLVANEPTDGEVQLTGKAHAVIPTVDPVTGAPCAMWRVGSRNSETLVEIRGERGTAVVDPTALRLEWSRDPQIVRGDEAKKVAELLRIELIEDALMLYVLPEGADCYVIGTPTWELAPGGSVGMYRDSPMLPTFRSGAGEPARFADRSEAQVRADHAWALASWATWGAMCAGMAVTQILGWT